MTIHATWAVEVGDCRASMAGMPANHFHCCVTSPPYYGLRSYGTDPVAWADGWSGSYGNEPTPDQFAVHTVEIFQAVKRVLRADGVLWLNIGDSFANDSKWGGKMGGKHAKGLHGDTGIGREKKVTGLKSKDLIGIPWMVAFALRADGWYLRMDNIWDKPNGMPESTSDRPGKTHEYVFMLTKNPRYFYDHVAVQQTATGLARWGDAGKYTAAANSGEKLMRTKAGIAAVGARDTRNLRSVWRIPVGSFKGGHFATMPPKLAARCILAGTSEKGCCRTCGAPWVREVVRERVPTRPGNATKVTGDTMTDGNRDPLRHVTTIRTVGWRPSCTCPAADPVPCRVLDPFGGSGTTAGVAVSLGRSAVVCELNPEYAALMPDRVADLCRPRKEKRAKSPAPTPATPSLFDNEATADAE